MIDRHPNLSIRASMSARSRQRPRNPLTRLIDIPLCIALVALFGVFVWLALRSA